MKKKKVLFMGAIMLLNYSYLLQAQIDKDKVYKYEVVRNNPEEAPNISFGVMPVYVDINDYNLNIGFGFHGWYRYKSMVAIEFSYQKAYFDRLNDNYSPYRVHGFAYETTSFTNFEIISRFFILKKLKDVEEIPVLKSSRSYNVTTNYVIKVPAKRLDIIGVRAGMRSSNSFIQSENGDIIFDGYPVKDKSKTHRQFSGMDYSTMMKTTTIVIGINRIKISDLIVNVEGFGEKTVEGVNEVYVDLLFAPSVKYANMLLPDSVDKNYAPIYYAEYNVDEFTKKSKMGYRIGFNHYSALKVGYSVGVELGKRPGINEGFLDNAYLLLKARVDIAFKI